MTLVRSKTWRRLAAALWSGALLLTLLLPSASAQTRRTRTSARRTVIAQQQQPVRVPQLPPATQTATPTPTPKQTPTPTPSQTPADAIDDDEVIRVTSNLVVVPASVTTTTGEPVQGLKPADFHLEEEGRAQEIAQVGDAEQVPLDIVILFDVSSSVTAKNFFTFQQQAAARFLKDVLKPIDRAAIITIADKATLVQPLTNAADATAKLVTIPAADRSVPTAFYDSVSFAAKYLNNNAPGRHRRVILVVSDGDDNFSNAVREQTVAEYEAQRKAEEAGGDRPQAVRAAAHADLEARHRRAVTTVQRDVQRADIVFYSINPGGPSIRLNESATRAQNSMQQIADATGGTAYVPGNADALATVFRQIANELRAQYLLQYYSNSNAPNGKYLTIKVSSPTHPDLRIRARQGYYVKK
jgi:Ca-activated chloride channel homolog